MLRSFISYRVKKAMNKLFLPNSPDGNSFAWMCVSKGLFSSVSVFQSDADWSCILTWSALVEMLLQSVPILFQGCAPTAPGRQRRL